MEFTGTRKSRGKIEVVKCGYQDCKAEPMLYQNLKDHTKTRHGDVCPIVKKPKGQPTLKDFLSTGKTKQKSDNEEPGPSKKRVCLSSTDHNENSNMIPDMDNSIIEEQEEKTDEKEKINKQVKKADENTEDSHNVKHFMNKLSAELKQTVEKTMKEALTENGHNTAKDKVHAVEVTKTAEEAIKQARSIKDISDKVPEFNHVPENTGKEFQCIICGQTFGYSVFLENDFSTSNMSEKFRNLKKNLVSHIRNPSHISQTNSEQANAMLRAKEENRNTKVGLTLSKIAYHLIHKGRPDTDFPSLVYISAAGGSDCGDINHSFHFPGKLLPHLANAVKGRLTRLLETRMAATGCLPPVNLFADKATHQRETRQLVGGITVNPGGEELLVALLFGVPKCAGGNGDQLCKNILEAIEPFVKAEQVVGFTGDGVYQHTKVTEKLQEKMNTKLEYTWDQMHRAGLVSTALMSGKKIWSKKFSWLVEMTGVIGRGVTLIAWGKPWTDFFDICKELENNPEEAFKMKRPAKFSETKFADHAHDVYDKFRNNYKPLVKLLEKAKEEGREGSSDQKKKAEKADEIQGKIYTWMFAFSLSLTTDVYKKFRIISCILQKINILSFEKYDIFLSLLSNYDEMLTTIPYQDCPCSSVDLGENLEDQVKEDVCNWPRFHQDVRLALATGTYRGVHMGMVGQEKLGTRAGAEANSQLLSVDLENIVKKMEHRGRELIDFIVSGLRDRVYTKEEVKVVESCRRLLDLKSQMSLVQEQGAVRISSLHYKSFREAALHLEPNLDERLDSEDMRVQFLKFNRLLEELDKSRTSLDTVRLLIDPQKKVYEGVEGIVSILVNSVIVKGGVESVCESMVSVMEAHTPSNRVILNQERLEDEIMVSWNGEDVFHCEAVCKEAMKSYWKASKSLANQDGHFIRRSQNVKTYLISESVDAQLKKPAKLSVMMD